MHVTVSSGDGYDSNCFTVPFCVCVCLVLCVCVFVFVFVCLCLYLCVCVCICVFVFVFLCLCLCLCLYPCFSLSYVSVMCFFLPQKVAHSKQHDK